MADIDIPQSSSPYQYVPCTPPGRARICFCCSPSAIVPQHYTLYSSPFPDYHRSLGTVTSTVEQVVPATPVMRAQDSSSHVFREPLQIPVRIDSRYSGTSRSTVSDFIFDASDDRVSSSPLIPSQEESLISLTPLSQISPLVIYNGINIQQSPQYSVENSSLQTSNNDIQISPTSTSAFQTSSVNRTPRREYGILNNEPIPPSMHIQPMPRPTLEAHSYEEAFPGVPLECRLDNTQTYGLDNRVNVVSSQTSQTPRSLILQPTLSLTPSSHSSISRSNIRQTPRRGIDTFRERLRISRIRTSNGISANDNCQPPRRLDILLQRQLTPDIRSRFPVSQRNIPNSLLDFFNREEIFG